MNHCLGRGAKELLFRTHILISYFEIIDNKKVGPRNALLRVYPSSAAARYGGRNGNNHAGGAPTSWSDPVPDASRYSSMASILLPIWR